MGLLGVTSVTLLVALSFNLSRFEGGTKYQAAFTEASGLKPSEDVRIAGVKVGKVLSVGLEGDHVKVAFTVDPKVRFGTTSRAAIKLSTILGSHYLEIQPSGPGRQSTHCGAPRTTSAGRWTGCGRSPARWPHATSR
jgi:phospholipid/cholesterol/gamma-HCH transport system substrate-binding protein